MFPNTYTFFPLIKHSIMAFVCCVLCLLEWGGGAWKEADIVSSFLILSPYTVPYNTVIIQIKTTPKMRWEISMKTTPQDLV